MLNRHHAGELPVGNAVIVPTQHSNIPYLIGAPTMRVPGDIADTVNVYLAFRAALLAVKTRTEIKTLLSPALGTGVGGMPIERAARQMYAAYAEVILGDVQWRSSALRAAHGDIHECFRSLGIDPTTRRRAAGSG